MRARAQDGKRGLGAAAVFIARNRFAVLEKASNQLVIKNLNNETTKQCAAPPGAPTDAIFYAGTGALLCRSEDKARACSMAAILAAVVLLFLWCISCADGEAKARACSMDATLAALVLLFDGAHFLR